MLEKFRGEKRNIYLFYLLTAVFNFWFIASNWIYFWTKFMTYGQLGWVDALGFGFALLLEIPSGAIADILGKRKTILIGAIIGTFGAFLISFSSSLTTIFIGWLGAQACYALYSGAGEALAYDTLLDLKKEKEYDKVISKSAQIQSWTSALTILAGGFLYSINLRLPHILWSFGFLLAVMFSWLLIEPKIDSEKFSLKKYTRQLVVGFRELTQTSLRKYMGFFFGLIGIFYIYSWGFLQPAIATSFGFFAKEQSIILPVLSILGAFVVSKLPQIRKRVSDLAGLTMLSVIMFLGFLITAFPVGYFGIISMILIGIVGDLSYPWISIVVNKKIESKYRATTLSTVALLTKLPYVLVAVLAGRLIDGGKLPYFNFATAFVVLALGLGTFVVIKIQKLRHA